MSQMIISTTGGEDLLLRLVNLYLIRIVQMMVGKISACLNLWKCADGQNGQN